MGDFFTRLAERTFGLAPVVQPDLMPVLLPAAESEVVSDSLPRLEETFERTATPARKAAPYDADSISRNMSITEIRHRRWGWTAKPDTRLGSGSCPAGARRSCSRSATRGVDADDLRQADG